mgnify:CR=1 FL=1
MTPTSKEPALVSALRMKGADYSKDLPEEMDVPEETEPAESDLSAMAEKIETLKGKERNVAIDSLVAKLQSLKS